MFDAGALSVAFNTILNNRIPSSRSVSEPYTNTFVCVNKIWNDSMNSVGGAASIELKGGKSLYYAARLIVHLGGVAKAGTKKLTATVKGETVNYGLITKVKVTKNQLPTPWNLTYESEMACVHCGLWEVDDLENYKKEHMRKIASMLEKQMNSTEEVKDNEISFEEVETDE